MNRRAPLLRRLVSKRSARYAGMIPRLSRARKVALGEALVWVPLTRLALRVFPWRRVISVFDRTPVRPGPPDWRRAQATVWAVDAVAQRFFPDSPCLPQALVGRRMLRRQGVETDLRIGASIDGGGAFTAHAWIEREGRVVLGENGKLPAYTPFNPLSSRGPERTPPSSRPSPSMLGAPGA